MILKKEPPDCRQQEQLDDNSQHKLVSEFCVRVLESFFHNIFFAINVPIVGCSVTICFSMIFSFVLSGVTGFYCVTAENVAETGRNWQKLAELTDGTNTYSQSAGTGRIQSE